jgi:hypothetical protein
VNSKPPLIPVEVLPPLPEDKPTGSSESHDAGAAFHPLAVTLMILVDTMWNLAEWAVIGWILTIPLSFMTVFWPALFIQHYVRKDGWGSAAAKALFLGVVAAVPTSVTGTPVGLALLAWAGIRRLRHS